MLILTPLRKASIRRNLDPPTFIITRLLEQPCERKPFHSEYAVERSGQMTEQQKARMRKKWCSSDQSLRTFVTKMWRSL